MNDKDTAQVNEALRELFLLHLGKEMDVEDMIDLLPVSIQEAYPEEVLYEAVEGYFNMRCEEDGFVFARNFEGHERILKIAPEECPYGLRDAERIAFSIGGLFQGHSSIDIERTSSGISIKTQHYGPANGAGETPASTLSDSEFEDMCAALDTIEILSWTGHYYSLVLDGTQWDLAIEFPENLIQMTSGSNAYPKGFNVLLQTLISCGLPEEYHDYEKECE